MYIYTIYCVYHVIMHTTYITIYTSITIYSSIYTYIYDDKTA